VCGDARDPESGEGEEGEEKRWEGEESQASAARHDVMSRDLTGG
jgi:hypothetical protein